MQHPFARVFVGVGVGVAVVAAAAAVKGTAAGGRLPPAGQGSVREATSAVSGVEWSGVE